MTFAGGEKFFDNLEFWRYVDSLSCIKNSDFVILTHCMPDAVKDKLIECNISVVEIDQKQVQYIYRDRHLCFYNYLKSKKQEYKYVLVTDCRDVIFQGDPFDYIQNVNRQDFVLMTSEGHRVKQSGFSCIERFEFDKDVPLQFRNHNNGFVINGGVFAGTLNAMKNWHFLVWSTHLKTKGSCTDQAVVDWLSNYLDEEYILLHPQDDCFCVTGEGIKEKAVQIELKDGVVYSKDAQKYYIVHQWDRFMD